jgi:hypothetical protein
MRRKTSVNENGCLTEVVKMGGHTVHVTYDDIPESDVTTVRGLRCTTPLRTVIDLGAELKADELERIIDDCLERELFTLEEAVERLAQPDISSRRGAQMVRDALSRREGWPLSA